MASGIYNRFKANLMNKIVDLEADTIKVALYDSTHVFTATDTDYTTTNEVLEAAPGYDRGGVTISSPSVTEAATTKWDDDGSDVAWAAATFTARHAVIYDSTLAGNDLIANIDFGSDKSVTLGTFTIQFSADGIITLA